MLAEVVPERCKDPPSFAHLPSNVLVDIACHLEPASLINLARCCNVLHIITHSHKVWSSALKNTAYESRVFIPSFPTEKMSIEELKVVSTRPLRLQSLLWDRNSMDQHNPVIRPAMVRILIPHIVTDPAYSDTNFRDLALIPGGRFLITSDQAERVCLWDLGCQPNTIFQRIPLAIKQFQGVNVLAGGQLLMQPTDDGQGVVISVNLASSPEDYLSEVHILEIYPTASCPTFNTVAVRHLSTSEEATATCHNMTSRFFAYHANKQIVFWEYRTDLQSRIACKDIADFLICDDVALVFREREKMNEHLTFIIPQPAASDVVSKIEPVQHAAFPMSLENYSMPLTWYTASHNNGHLDRRDIHMDVLGQYDGKHRILHYIFTQNPSVHPSSPLLTLLRTHNTKDDIDLPAEFHLTTSITANGERLLTWVDDEHLWIKISRGPPVTNGINLEGESIKRILYKWEDDEADIVPQSQSADPFSGRVCVLTWRGEIRIMDFVV